MGRAPRRSDTERAPTPRSIRRRVIEVGLVLTVAPVLFAVGGLGLLRGGRTAPAPGSPAPRAAAPLAATATLGSGSLDQVIGGLQDRVRAVPADWRALADLGSAYVQQARVTADPTYYPRADGVLRRSLATHPDGNVEAFIGMASLAAARHDFAGARSWAQRAIDANPANANARAVMGDALVELGRYPEGFDAFQRAVDLKPDVATYARASYAWELQGNVPNAIAIMRMALAAAGTDADRAWASFQLGELEWNRGHVAAAGTAYRGAIRWDPSYRPPQFGLAKVDAARGRTARAVREMAAVVRAYPSPDYVIWLSDLLSSAGRSEDAARQAALVDVETKLFRSNGVNVDLEIALFDADHGRGPEALAAARAEWARRQSVNVADALAWALYANGRPQEALRYADRALSLRSRNALFFFHRGMIRRALEDPRAARTDLATALDINPNFSVRWAPTAVRVLHLLEARP
jgi:tetratricopeptide (TPR) repeat protein